MKLLVLVACLAVFASANKEEFKAFKLAHGKNYKSLIEERLRYEIFQNNLKEIEEHNARYAKGLETYTMGVNKFADWTKDEFLSFLKLSGPKPRSASTKVFTPSKVKAAPSEIDWRSSGVVTPVKDQGSCGSCWGFSATGSLEAQNQLVNGKLVSLSEQNLVDCSTANGNQGCNGGLMDYAFDYVRDNGINSEADYPYEGRDGKCRFNKDASVLNVKSYVDIKEDAEDDLLEAVGTVGPVSVAIDASLALQFYSGGIFNDVLCSKYALNHGVLAVGYGEENGTKYWLVKNSWGSFWGESGYVKFKRGSNLCGIATSASYPQL